MTTGFVGWAMPTATQLATLYRVNHESGSANLMMSCESKGLQPLVWVGIVRRTRGCSPLNDVGTVIRNRSLKARNSGFIGASNA